MKRYVAGFLFNKEGDQVALIEKLRPEWQKFKLNGIGGHIEEGETPDEAMSREFREETGVELESWVEYCVLSGPDYEVHFFQSYDDALYNVDTKTDEQVRIYDVDHILNPTIACPMITNLRWLIPMALSLVYEPHMIKYQVQEVDTHVYSH